MNLIPWPYRLLTWVALAAALVGAGWFKGAGHVQHQWDAAVAEQARQVAKVEKQQAEATVQVVTRYIDRVKVIREKGDAIIKEVPVYVPSEADAVCTIHRGFVRLHDAAASNVIPRAAEPADARPAGIALSAVATTLADNYQRCHENAEQLIALQDWVRQMQAAATPESSE